jgi:hypothetical protein
MDVQVVTALEETTRLDAGQTLRIAQPVFEIDKLDTESDGLLPKYHIGAGRYRVNVSGGEMDSMAPPSGMLDLEIVE